MRGGSVVYRGCAGIVSDSWANKVPAAVATTKSAASKLSAVDRCFMVGISPWSLDVAALVSSNRFGLVEVSRAYLAEFAGSRDNKSRMIFRSLATPVNV